MISVNFENLSSIESDDTGQRVKYFIVDEGERKVHVFDSFEKSIQGYRKIFSGRKIKILNESVSHLIHHSCLPANKSIISGIMYLGIGDSLKCMDGKSVVIENEFPYYNKNSSQESTSSPEMLMEVLCGAVSKVKDRNVLLMLSSGKDSVSLACASALVGMRNLKCVTFSNHQENEESAYANKLCQHLGIAHETCYILNDPKMIKRSLIDYFSKTTTPCVDHVQIPYLLTLSQISMETESVIMDGMGSDIFWGHLPPKKNIIKEFISVPRMQSLRKYFNFDSKIEKMFQTRSELNFPSPLLRYVDTKNYYPNSVDTHAKIYRFDKKYKDLDILDFRNFSRGRIYDIGIGTAMQKARNAAEFVGAESFFPWCDRNVVEYCFNLPEQKKFSRDTFKNKILVREMLEKYCDYDDQKLPKRGFEFDGADFVLNNIAFIEEEIFGCSLWERNKVQEYFNDLLNMMKINRKVNYPILIMFMISGWYNHYYKKLELK